MVLSPFEEIFPVRPVRLGKEGFRGLGFSV